MFSKQSSDSWLIVGLGNPGREYEKTRHNTGFRAMDVLAEKLNAKVDRLKFQGLGLEQKQLFPAVIHLRVQTLKFQPVHFGVPYCSFPPTSAFRPSGSS